MIRGLKSLLWRAYSFMDAKLKFPNLKNGEVGIQAGFDMDYPLTTDLFSMYSRVSPNGMLLGIEADPRNIEMAAKYIEANKLNIKLSNCALFSSEGEAELLLGESKSWNQLNTIPMDDTVSFSGKKIKLPLTTLDRLVQENGIDVNRISHINLTINGAEYYALLGMKKILTESQNINLSIVAGRYDDSGFIQGVADYIKITELLQSYGFVVKFKRMQELFWWGFITKALLNRKWIYGQNNYGVVFASKGDKKLKWYQSFS